MQSTPISLLDRLRSQPASDEAWRQIVAIYQPWLERWLRGRVAQAADVDDIVQTVLAVSGLVVTAGYMLKTVRGTMQGPLNTHGAMLKDAKGLQKLPYVLLIAGLLAVGCLPSLILPTIMTGTKPVLERMAHAN